MGERHFSIGERIMREKIEAISRELENAGEIEFACQVNKVLADQSREATFYKKFKELEYFTSRNTTTRVQCDSVKAAKKIIEKSGIEQQLKIA